MTKARQILEKARRLAGECKTWADLSNALFDPVDGEVVRMFPTREQRAAFRKTTEYGRLHTLVEDKMKATGVVSGATPEKSGRFVVRLPRSLHAALEREAAEERTSLNQLVVAKLAARLDNLRGGRTGAMVQAFLETRQGFSADRVIADPKMDQLFLGRCRELGLSGTDFQLNWELMRARKDRDLSGVPATKRYTVRGTDEFEYASELAVRHLQLTKDASLDQVLCDPDLAAEFDKCASRLAPGFSPLQYRWAALGLRKAGRLKKLKQRVLDVPDLEPAGEPESLRLEDMPEVGGLYLFSSSSTNVFMSQTSNLKHRLERHLCVSDLHGLPTWLWDVQGEPLQVSLAALPGVGKTIRQAMEMLLLNKYHPVLNFERKAA